MIFDLNTALISTASKVMHKGVPIAYSWGNEDALHKWVESMNKKALAKHLGIKGTKKYPLIWLVEGWEGKKNTPGMKFEKVVFYISCNSTVAALNEDRVVNFNLLYKIANDFIKELRYVIKIGENSISYKQKSNFSTVSSREEKKSITSDVWDTLIVEMDLIANTNCLKKLCSL